MITIKPHHLIDIIKLYGAGVEHFVPDEAFQHDFYKVANHLLEDLDTQLQFTIYGDDICKPCNRYKHFRCSDPLDSIQGYHAKDTYNQALDSRLISLLDLDVNEQYTVRQVVEYLHSHKDIVLQVWLEEADELTNRRNDLLQAGIRKDFEELS